MSDDYLLWLAQGYIAFGIGILVMMAAAMMGAPIPYIIGAAAGVGSMFQFRRLTQTP